jgi:hypothetical protein
VLEDGTESFACHFENLIVSEEKKTEKVLRRICGCFSNVGTLPQAAVHLFSVGKCRGKNRRNDRERRLNFLGLSRGPGILLMTDREGFMFSYFY